MVDVVGDLEAAAEKLGSFVAHIPADLALDYSNAVNAVKDGAAKVEAVVSDAAAPVVQPVESFLAGVGKDAALRGIDETIAELQAVRAKIAG